MAHDAKDSQPQEARSYPVRSDEGHVHHPWPAGQRVAAASVGDDQPDEDAATGDPIIPISRPPASGRQFAAAPLLVALTLTLAAVAGVAVFMAINAGRQRDALLAEKGQIEGQARDSDTAAQKAQKAALDAADLAKKKLDEARTAADFAAQNERRSLQREQFNQRNLYVAQIRLAKQAWDRGETNLVYQLLDPYRTDPAKQSQRTFAWYYLWSGLRDSGSSALRGHTATVRQAAFTPDGVSVATLGDDGQLVLWNAATGAKSQTVSIEPPAGPTLFCASEEDQLARLPGGLALGFDGTWVAAFGKTVAVGNFNRPEHVRHLGNDTSGNHQSGDHQSPIISLAMSRDGKLLATGDYQGTILVRNLPDGRIVQRWNQVRPQTLSFGSDGRRLLAGMHDGGVFVWEVASGTLLISARFGEGIRSLAVAPDGQTVAVALADREGVVRLWEPAAGRIRAELRGHSDEVTCVAFAPDSKTLVTASRDFTARLWSTSGSLLRTLKGHLAEVETAAFSPDGRKVVTAGDDQTAILWNVDDTPQGESLADAPSTGWVDSLVFSPADDQLIGAGCCDGFEAFLTSWNLAGGNRPNPLQTTSRTATAMGFSPDGKRLATGEAASRDAAVKSRARIWNMETGRVIATETGLVGPVNSTVYSPDGRFLAIATGTGSDKAHGTVKILEAATGAVRQTLPEMTGRVESAFSPDGKQLVTIASGGRRPAEIRVWNPITGELLGGIDNPRQLDDLTAMALSPDGRYLVTGHADPADASDRGKVKLKLWDLGRRDPIAVLPAVHTAPISRLVFSRRGMLLASGDASGMVRVWDFAARKPLAAQVPSQGHAITDLAFDLLGNRIVTADEEKCIRVWNVDTARPLATLELALGTPAIVRFTPDGKLLGATTTAGGLFFWDSNTYAARAVFRAEGNPVGQDGHGSLITCAASTGRDGSVLTGSVDKTVKLWDIRTKRFVSTVLTLDKSVSCLSVAPDGRWLAVGTGKYRKTFEPGDLSLCDLDVRASRSAPHVLVPGITVTSLAFSPDGTSLAYCGLTPDAGRGPRRSAGLINLTAGRILPLATSECHSIAFSPDGRTLAVGRADGQIDLLSVAAGTFDHGRTVTLRGHRGVVTSVCFSPDGATLASGADDNNVKIWDTTVGEELLTLKHNGAVEAVRFSSDGQVLATADREAIFGSVRLWRAPSEVR